MELEDYDTSHALWLLTLSHAKESAVRCKISRKWGGGICSLPIHKTNVGRRIL